jgi:uncharacterized membrane protein
MSNGERNLTAHRGGISVWERMETGRRAAWRRRAIVACAAVAMIAMGRRRSVVARLVGSAGATLLWRAATGHDDIARVAELVQSLRAADPRVDEASAESFPASDSPASYSSAIAR